MLTKIFIPVSLCTQKITKHYANNIIAPVIDFVIVLFVNSISEANNDENIAN